MRPLSVSNQHMTKYFLYQGFFVRTCSEAVLKLAQHAEKTRKIFAFNLSAEYVCQTFGEQIMDLLPFVDFLFGNEQVRCRMKVFIIA